MHSKDKIAAAEVEKAAAIRMQYAGAIGLLCELSTRITDEFEQEALDQCVSAWCRLTGWTWNRVLDRVEIFPPETTS